MPFIVTCRLDYEADVSSVRPLSEKIFLPFQFVTYQLVCSACLIPKFLIFPLRRRSTTVSMESKPFTEKIWNVYSYDHVVTHVSIANLFFSFMAVVVVGESDYLGMN